MDTREDMTMKMAIRGHHHLSNHSKMVLSPTFIAFIDVLVVIAAFVNKTTNILSNYEKRRYGRRVQVVVRIDDSDTEVVHDLSNVWTRIWLMTCHLVFGYDVGVDVDSSDVRGYYRLFDGTAFLAKTRSPKECLVATELSSAKNKCFIVSVNGDVDITDSVGGLAGSLDDANGVRVNDVLRLVVCHLADVDKIVDIAASMLRHNGAAELRVFDVGTMEERAFGLDELCFFSQVK